MKNRQNKKGFTLVELLVVIAIVAILAAVSVVGYLSFTNKAKEANDQSLVKQLNIVLAGNEAVDGKNKTYSDAIEDMEEAGFSVDKMTPTASKNDILWDQISDRFVLIKENEVTLKDDQTNVDLNKKSLLWKMYEEVPAEAEQDYSIYLRGTDKVIDNEITLKTGFDAGKNKSNYKLLYNGNIPSTEKVVIKTNSSDTELRVNTTTSTVEHYGNLGKANIENVPTTDCYHEFGKTVYAILTAGKLVMETNSKIEILNVTATDAAKVELVVNTNSTITNPYCEDSTVLEKVKTVVETVTQKDTEAIQKDVAQEMENALAEENNADVKISKDGLKDEYISLAKFRDNVNTVAEYNGYEGYTIKLLKDVDLNNTNWVSIGTGNQPFMGTFDGNGKTISNFKSQGTWKVGLFGYVGKMGAKEDLGLDTLELFNKTNLFNYFNESTGKFDSSLYSIDKYQVCVKNVTVDGATVEATKGQGAFLVGFAANAYIYNNVVKNSTLKAPKQSGGIVGDIAEFSVVDKNTVEDTATLNFESNIIQHVGGIVGQIRTEGALIINNVNNGKIIATSIQVGNNGGSIINLGGIVGFCLSSHDGLPKDAILPGTIFVNNINNGTIDATSNKLGSMGGIYGGFCSGASMLAFINCTNHGTITGNKKAEQESPVYVGGIAATCTGYLYMNNCTNDGSINVTNLQNDFIGGLVGHTNSKIKLVNCTLSADQVWIGSKKEIKDNITLGWE